MAFGENSSKEWRRIQWQTSYGTARFLERERQAFCGQKRDNWAAKSLLLRTDFYNFVGENGWSYRNNFHHYALCENTAATSGVTSTFRDVKEERRRVSSFSSGFALCNDVLHSHYMNWSIASPDATPGIRVLSAYPWMLMTTERCPCIYQCPSVSVPWPRKDAAILYWEVPPTETVIAWQRTNFPAVWKRVPLPSFDVGWNLV